MHIVALSRETIVYLSIYQSIDKEQECDSQYGGGVINNRASMKEMIERR